jgi:hypothetical protein
MKPKSRRKFQEKPKSGGFSQLEKLVISTCVGMYTKRCVAYQTQTFPCTFYLLFICTNKYIYIKILNYITNASTCFGVSALFSGSFDIAFAKVIKY